MIRKIFSFVRENIQLCPGKYSALSGENTGAAVWKTRRLAHNTHFDQIHACKTSKVPIKTQNKDFFVKLARLKHLLNFASLLKQRWGDQICHNYIDFVGIFSSFKVMASTKRVIEITSNWDINLWCNSNNGLIKCLKIKGL